MIKNIIKHTIENRDADISLKRKILPTGTEVFLLDVGVVKFEPKTACDTSLVISCGIHGNETAPQEIIQKIISDLLEGEQKCGQRTLFIFGNPWGMAEHERFIDINMNRLFCQQWKSHDISIKEVGRAAKLESHIDKFFSEDPATIKQRLHYDCHTSIRPSQYSRFAVYPFLEGRKLPDDQLAFIAFADIKAILLQSEPSNTFSSHTSRMHQAESFTLELGKVKSYGNNDLAEFSGISCALRKLIAGDFIPEEPDKNVDIFEVCHEIIKTDSAWQFFVKEKAYNFSEFDKGFIIWQDKNREYKVKNDTEYIVFPNSNVPIGQRAGLMLKKV